jgi:hypothetical protein
MTAVRAPKTTAQAAAMLERFAELGGQVAALEGRRARMMARTNAAIDTKVVPLLEEQAAIAEKAEPWWAKAGPALAKDRKSIELGGCIIGTRLSSKSLAHDYDTDLLAAMALRGTPLRNRTTRIKFELDKPALKMLIAAGDKAAKSLAALGFRLQQGEMFILERAQQGGTIG